MPVDRMAGPSARTVTLGLWRYGSSSTHVTDGGEDFAFDPRSVEDARNRHFGLLFVDRLADRWGLSLDGKTAFWLEVDNPPSHLTLPSAQDHRAKLSVGAAVGSARASL